jgi:hypothetical protein
MEPSEIVRGGVCRIPYDRQPLNNPSHPASAAASIGSFLTRFPVAA